VNVAVSVPPIDKTAFEVGLTVPVYEPVPVVPLLAATVTVMVAFVVDETEYDVATPSAVKPTHAASDAPVESKPRLVTDGIPREACGVIEADAGETVDVVPLPEGVTVKVYAVPLVKPLTVHVSEPAVIAVALETMHVLESGVELTV
jgi:hypothetical protein